ncbi:hypothetical protein EFE32_08140 [Lactococcus lactis subsp. lactis]|uniref:hypothetical protein n=1 Tax=Lactococcus lactis TaxID=1358 RepID=UPI00223B9607|nr:hypothetical protein [Lactococcus lactis]MCT0016809.1 hypothetical protein [Lactococcus lactis subsp. lactis]
MKMIKSIRKSILLLIGSICLLCIVASGIFYHRNLPDYAAKNAAQAVKADDFNRFLKFVPEFSNHQKISKSEFDRFVGAKKKTTVEKIKQELLNKESFKEVSRGFFATRQFYPIARQVILTTEDDASHLAIAENQSLQTGDKAGPFIPARYNINYKLTSPQYGNIDKTANIDLTKQDGRLNIQEKTNFLMKKNVQKGFLKLYTGYIQSFANCINNDFNFSKLDNTSSDYSDAINDYYTILKNEIESYKESFQTIIINTDSMKMDNDNRVEFDAYVDIKTSLQIKGNSTEQDNRTNVTVTAIFDSSRKQWVIDNENWEVSSENPKDWLHQLKNVLDKLVVANWSNKRSGAV